MVLKLRLVADALISASAMIGAIGLLFEVAIILIDVIGRSFGMPLVGSQDMITMAMVITVFGAMALCDRRGGHIAVDIFERHYPSFINRAIDILAAFLGAIIFAGFAWAVYDSARISLMLNLATNVINLPKAWFQWALCGFAMLTACGMLLRSVELAVTGRDIRRERENAA